MGMERKMENSEPQNVSKNNDEVQNEFSNGPEKHRQLNVVQQTTHLAASTSSPSLLTGCGDSSTHAGANIERHIHSHCVRQDSVTASDVVDNLLVNSSTQTTPQPSPAVLIDPPDSIFLTPAPSRPRHTMPERPNSAPPQQLERISGTLLRLVGDHYMCSTCGRELRTLGDQLTLETNLRHALSSGDLERIQNMNL